MYDLGPIVSAAEAKLAQINQLEQETNELLFSPVDKLVDCLRRRQIAIDSLTDADLLLKNLCDSRDKLETVIDLTCDVASLPSELVPLFELTLSARAGINRVFKIEPLISERLEQERSSIINNIESLNVSATAAGNKYYRSFHAAGQDAVTENNKTI